MKTLIKVQLALLVLSVVAFANELDELDFSRFALLNDGDGTDAPAEKEDGHRTEYTFSEFSELYPELEIVGLTEKEKEEAKSLTLKHVNTSLSLPGGASVIPQFSLKLSEDSEELGEKGTKVWSVILEEPTSKDPIAFVFINPETKKIELWTSQGERIEIVEPVVPYNSGQSLRD